MKKKIISMLLILSLVIQCVPATAFASQGGDGRSLSSLLAEKPTLDDVKKNANNATKETYDNATRTIDLTEYIFEGYDIDRSKLGSKLENIVKEDNGNLLGDKSSLKLDGTKLSFTVGDITGSQTIKFEIPVKKDADKYNIVLTVTVNETKITVPKQDYNFVYNGQQILLKKNPPAPAPTGTGNVIYYEYAGLDSDIGTNFEIDADWYLDGQKFTEYNPPKNVGNYQMVLFIKDKITGNRISEATKVNVKVAPKDVHLSDLKVVDKVYNGNSKAVLNFNSVKIADTATGEKIKIKESSKEKVTATFDNEFVGKNKSVTLTGSLELENDVNLASNYKLVMPKDLKGNIVAVKREIELVDDINAEHDKLIVGSGQLTNDSLKKAVKNSALLEGQGESLTFKIYNQGTYVDLTSCEVKLGNRYKIQVTAPEINKNGGEPEYLSDTKYFTVYAKTTSSLELYKSKKIEYSGSPVDVKYGTGAFSNQTSNGIYIKYGGGQPSPSWYQSVGVNDWELTPNNIAPSLPGKYKVIVRSGSNTETAIEKELEFEIEKKEIKITGAKVYNRDFIKDYDAAIVDEVYFNATDTLDKNKYEIVDAVYTDINSNEGKKPGKDIVMTIALKNEGLRCYIFDNKSSIATYTVPANEAKIFKATFPNTENDKSLNVPVNAKKGVQSYVDLTDYLCYDARIEKITTSESFTDKLPEFDKESRGLKFQLKNIGTISDPSFITIRVNSDNYKAYTIKVSVHPTDLVVPKVRFKESDSIVYNGKPIYFKDAKKNPGNNFSDIVFNGLEYMCIDGSNPDIKWYTLDENGDAAQGTTTVPTKAGEYILKFTFAKTDKQEANIVSKRVVIEDRKITITDFKLADKVYDTFSTGDAKQVTQVSFADTQGVKITDISKNDTNGYTVDSINYGQSNVGENIPVSIKIHLNGTAAQNYTLKKDSFMVNNGKIVKAVKGNQTVNTETLIGEEGSVELKDYLTSSDAKIDIDYSQNNEIFKPIEKPTGGFVPVIISGNALKYTIKDADTIGSRKTGTIILNVDDPNYEKYSITIKITAVSRDEQAPLHLTCGSALKFGETLRLSYSGGSGDGKVTYEILEGGTGAAVIKENKADNSYYLEPISIGKVDVVATKAADTIYAEKKSSKKTITISKGVAKGTPTFTPIVKPGVRLSTVVLGSNNMIPSGGEFKWSGSASTIVEKHKSYKWTYTPADKDKDNYAPVTGELVLYEKDDPNATKPNVELPAVPSSAAGKDSFGMTADQQANNKISIESMVADILQGVEHVVPADAETKRTEKAIQDETKKGQKIKIKVEARRVTEGQVSSDASKIKALLDKEYGKDKYTVVQYGAIAIKAQTEDKHLGFLTELNQRLSFTIQLPSGAYGYYHMARMHGGKAELLDDGDVTFDSKTKRVTFYADRFSTYLLFRTGPGGGDIPGTIDPNDPNNPYDPNDPNNPNKPDGSNDPNNPNTNKPGYIYPVTNIKLSTDHGLIKVSFKKSRTKNIKYYSIAYRPMKKCTCGRWHTAGKADYKGIKGTVTTIRVKKNVPYRIKVAAVTDYGSSIYKMGGIRYANRNGKRSARMYDADIYSSYSKKGSRSMTIKVRKIRYSNQPSPIMYQYFYKRKGTSKWHSVKTKSHIRTIRHLRRGKTYSVKVRFYYQSRLSKYKKVYSKYDYDSVKIR